MKVLQINEYGNLSTGKIAVDIARTVNENGGTCTVAYARNVIANDIDSIVIGNKMDVYLHVIMTRLTDKTGFYSKRATRKLLKQIDRYQPDIIHIHNIHGYYINLPLLFSFIKEKNIPVVWTLHDCWSFTGHCAHFELAGCEKWKKQCVKCELTKKYPSSWVDNSQWNYHMKKVIFNQPGKMAIVTPSYWLSHLVQQSFLKRYPVNVIHNGIDLDVFKPTDSNWKQEHKLEKQKIILGVAGVWTDTKGLDDLIKLSEMLNEGYTVVVVGVSKKQKSKLPPKMCGITRTYDSTELVKIYSLAEYFVNPTYEDNFPTVNLEALACGTPVITYNTGGSPESINENSGIIVNQGDVGKIAEIINSQIRFERESCVNRAGRFNRKDSFYNYYELYKKIIIECEK